MKRVVKLLTMMLFVVTAIMCTGCSVNSNIKMTEEGKGTQEVKIGVDKAIFKEEYMKVSSTEEIANLIKNKISDSRINVTVDTKSSSTMDYIVASFVYDSVEEMDALIQKFGDKVEALDIAGLEDVVDDESEEDVEKTHVEALKEYFDANGITYTADSEGFNKFVALFEKAMDSEDEDEDSTDDLGALSALFDLAEGLEGLEDIEDFDDDESEEFLKTIIEKKENSSQLKIGADNVNAFAGYIVAIMISDMNSMFDIDKMSNDIVEAMLLEDKNDYLTAFNKVNLADAVKKVLVQEKTEDTDNVDTNEEAGTTCNIDAITDEQLNNIFTKDLVNAIKKAYYGDDEEDIDFDEEDVDIDFSDMLDDSQDVLTSTITYGNQEVKLSVEDLIEFADEDGYITIDSVKGLISPDDSANLSQANHVDDVDDTPKTGDKVNILLFGIVGILAAMVAVGSVYVYKKNR